MNYNFAHKEEMSREMGTIYMALDAVTKYIAGWLDRNLKTLDSDYWNRYVITALFPVQQETVRANGAKTVFDLDQPTILSVFLQNKSVLVRELGVDPQLFGYAHSIKDIRNKYFHKNSKPLPQKRFKHDIETIVLFLEGLGAGQEIIEDVRGGFEHEEKTVAEATGPTKAIKIRVSSGAKSIPRNIVSETTPQPVKKPEPASDFASENHDKSISLSFDTKGYPQTIRDRLNARQIVGFTVETLFGQDAENLYRECKAAEAGYELVSVHFAVLVKRGHDAKDSLKDVKEKLDRGFVGLIEEFQNAIINPAHDFLVWFFGDKGRIEFPTESETIKLVEPPSSVPTIIPNWFQQTIRADELPYLSVDEVQTTLDLSERDVDRYAKTYSPRSFAEGVVVGKSLPVDFLQRVSTAGHFTMLDVGCGTAALSLGMIHGLDRMIDKASACSVKLDLVDGNPQMMAKARAFTIARDTVHAHGISSIEYGCVEKQISKVVDCFPRLSYDLIVTSKFLGELVCRGMHDVFTAFFKEAYQHLSSGGQIILVEVPKHRELIETAVRSLPKGLGKVSVRDVEVHPAFVGSDSEDSESVLVVLLSK